MSNRCRASRTQAELAHQARVSEAYLGRLERAEGEPGIDLVARLARALGTTAADLQPDAAPPDELGVLKEQARSLLDVIQRSGDRELLLLLIPLLRMFADKTR